MCFCPVVISWKNLVLVTLIDIIISCCRGDLIVLIVVCDMIIGILNLQKTFDFLKFSQYTITPPFHCHVSLTLHVAQFCSVLHAGSYPTGSASKKLSILAFCYCGATQIVFIFNFSLIFKMFFSTKNWPDARRRSCVWITVWCCLLLSRWTCRTAAETIFKFNGTMSFV